MGLESSKVEAAATQHSIRMMEESNVNRAMIMGFCFSPSFVLCYAIFVEYRNLKQGIPQWFGLLNVGKD